MRQIVLLTISALTMIGSVIAADTAWAQQPGSGRTIRYSQSNALGATYISDQVAIAALEKLGYKVAVTVLAPAAFLQSASQGDMDMSTSINFPQSQVPYQRLEKQLALVGDGSIVGGGVNGYMIDKKTAEAHKLTGIEQLKDPKIAALFDNNRTGKATLINCDPGWSCGDVVEFQLEKFGLTGTVRSVRGKYEALMGETFSRYRAGEPVSGIAAYLRDSGARLVDHDPAFGTLWHIDTDPAAPMLMVEVENRSPEPDGTYRHFLLRVDPELRPLRRGGFGRWQPLTARNAVASTFGLTGAEYAPEIET